MFTFYLLPDNRELKLGPRWEVTRSKDHFFLYSQYWVPMVLISMISISIAIGIHQMSARDAYNWRTHHVINETNWSTEILNWWRGMLEMTKFYHRPISKVMLVCQHDRIVWSFDLFRPSFHYKIRRKRPWQQKAQTLLSRWFCFTIHQYLQFCRLQDISSTSNTSTPPAGRRERGSPRGGRGRVHGRDHGQGQRAEGEGRRDRGCCWSWQPSG